MGRGANFNLNDCSDKSEKKCENNTFYTWDDIKNDKNWIVINEKVYDVTNFIKRHPGGERLMSNHIGQDVSDAFTAFHVDINKVNKYLKGLEIGRLSPNTNAIQNASPDDENLMKDFRDLRALAEKMGLNKTNFMFYSLHFIQIILLEVIAIGLFYYFGNESWLTYIAATLILVTSQAQAGWLQHDFGHLSVFKSTKLDHIWHNIVISTIKGVSSDWWNYRHFQHHAKPNTVKKDPDVRFGALLVLGKILPRELGEKKLGKLPYNKQQNYFFLIVPPLLLPVYFNFENLYFLYKRKNVKELLWALSFFVRWAIMFGAFFGFFGALRLYLLVRFIESYWFVVTTQMSHLPMAIDRDQNLNWFRLQLSTTCNVEQSFFNDWFSGHLNFQIEHHLFPTMPRHNYYKIAPYVKSLCEKYNIQYECKTLSKAIADIYISLKQSGDIWYDAYNM